MPNDAVPLTVTRDAAAALWSVSTRRHLLGVPLVDGEEVLLLVDGHLTCLAAADGRQVWRSPDWVGEIEYPRSTPLTVAGDYVLVPSGTTARYSAQPVALVCLRRADGGLAWRSDTVPLSGYQADGQTLVRWQRDKEVDGPRYIEAVDLADGRVLWRHEHDLIDDVLVAHGRVFARTGNTVTLAALDARTGTRLWRRTGEQARGGLAAVRGAGIRKTVLLAVSPRSGVVTRIDPVTGADLVSRRLSGASRYGARWNGKRLTGPDAWVGFGRLRVRRLGPLDSLRKQTFYAPLQELYWYEDDAVAEVTDRLYAVAKVDLGDPDYRRARGKRIVSARVGGLGPRLLTGLRWPRGVPRRERRGSFVELTPGPRHLFAVLHRLDGQGLISVRDNRVRWRRPAHPGLPVPLGGDRVLVFDDCGAHDHLRVLDAETGLGAEPQVCDQPSSPTA
ncbi:PQQ-binding-like beta-propeller repeat protein [Kitasatospora sp. NPDC048365]|uniref:outer membrane protein assembly factor BamB family protein n=1 Tax=Kitasatospora sp. NPDC048365 TaxID=3364050 RepID=UPI00371AD79F